MMILIFMIIKNDMVKILYFMFDVYYEKKLYLKYKGKEGVIK